MQKSVDDEISDICEGNNNFGVILRGLRLFDTKVSALNSFIRNTDAILVSYINVFLTLCPLTETSIMSAFLEAFTVKKIKCTEMVLFY